MTESVVNEKANEKPALFISYGRADGAELLTKLAGDLSDEWEVLYDQQFLRGGDRWSPAILEAIRRSRVLVLILTPHSVREGDNPSVCHDELLAAQARKIPVVPVMWRLCEHPLTVTALQHIDFENLSYPAALKQLRVQLKDISAGKAVPRVHRLTEAWSLRPDFAAVLRNVNPDDFRGRDWLFERIADWRRNSDGARLLLITANPGTGKSAIAAHFARSEPCGPVLAAHFCGKQAPTTLEPQNLVRNLAYLLDQQLPQYRNSLMEARRQEELDELARDAGGNLPTDDLLRVALSPLRELPNPLPDGAAPAWLVVDALDEALEYARAKKIPSIVDLIAAELPLLPPWLRILATSRSGDVPAQLAKVVQDGRPLVDRIHVTKEDSAQDIGRYVEDRIERARASLADKDKALIAERGGGNFLYVKLILDALFRRDYDIGGIRGLPPELDGFYSTDFRRLYGHDSMNGYAQRARPLLAAAVVAQDDLSADALSLAAALSAHDVHAELRRLSAYVVPRDESASARNRRYSIFHKSFSDWLCDPDNAGDYAVAEEEGHAALAGLCLKRFGELARGRIRGLNDLEGHEISEYLVRFGIDHLVGAAWFPQAIELLHFITAKSQQGRQPAKIFADVVPGRFKRRVLRGLKDCREEDKPLVNAKLLQQLLIDFYQVEPLEAPIKILLHHHSAQWDDIQNSFLAADNYVLRYAVSEAIADACLDENPSMPIQKFYDYLRHADINLRELGAYALRHTYGERPDWIRPEFLKLMGDSDTYAGRSALGDLMLTLTFQQEPDLPEIHSRLFWEPIWDHNHLDVWDLKAANAFIAGASPPEACDAGTLAAYDNFTATEEFRDRLERKLDADPETDPPVKMLVTREGFASLARDAKQIGAAEDALYESKHLSDLMRLFFSHPLWEVAETAASSLAAFAEKDFQKRAIVSDLFGDPYWRVCFGAIETAYQLVDFDRLTLFREAVNRFYDHKNSRVRALCAENLIAYMLDCPAAVRERYLEEFDAAVRYWIADSDAWVLEHVLRLLKTLDKSSPGCGRYFGEQIPFLLQGLPAPLPLLGWSGLSRADFLTHIETRKRAQVTGSA